MGNNTSIADLLVRSQTGSQFWVDVKGLGSSGGWNVKPREGDRALNLYYIFVEVGKTRDEDQFYVLTCE
jgi:hypothetical protein